MEKRIREIYGSISAFVTSPEMSSMVMHEVSTLSLRETYLRMHEKLGTDLSLEIGAREAEYSLRLKEIYGSSVAVCAIEGSPRTYRHFSEANDFKGRQIAYINTVMSSHNGTTKFYEYEDEDPGLDTSSGFSSIFVRDGAFDSGKIKTKVTVKCLRGDTFIAAKYPDKNNIALWIDVEGAQREVLSSFAEALSGKVNSVYIEVEGIKLWPGQSMLADDVIRYMDSHGFVPFLRDNQFDIQYNIIFLNRKVLDQNQGPYAELYVRLLLEKGKEVTEAVRKALEKRSDLAGIFKNDDL